MDPLPAIYLAHGQPFLIYPSHIPTAPRQQPLSEIQGPNGKLVQFLKAFGKTIREQWHVEKIVVLSAHWETEGEILVSDYGDENPLLYDYYNFPSELYEAKFKSRGDSALSRRCVELLRANDIKARLSPRMEGRGLDGKSNEQKPGLDHGVFVPFKHMLGDETDIPIVQVSIDSSLDPEDEYKLGQALAPLRNEKVLIIAGGLTVHTFRDFSAFAPSTAKPVYHDWCRAITSAASTADASQRKKDLFNLRLHPGFRLAHPREEHFATIWVAAGAGDDGNVAASGERTLSDLYGAQTFAFGVPRDAQDDSFPSV